MSGRPSIARVLPETALILFSLLVFVFLFAPLIIVMLISFSGESYLTFPPASWSTRWYATARADPAWTNALWNSVRIGLPVAALAVVLGTMAALVVARGKVAWSGYLAALVTMPLMLPTIILAIGLYPTMIDFRLNSTFFAVIFAHAVIATPMVFIMVRSALQAYSPTLELAAQTLGAGWFVAFRRITLPMIAPSLLTAAAFAFTSSFDELILALFLATPSTNTLPRIIWERLSYEVSPVIAAVATLILCLSFTLLALVATVRRGGIGLEGTSK